MFSYSHSSSPPLDTLVPVLCNSMYNLKLLFLIISLTCNLQTSFHNFSLFIRTCYPTISTVFILHPTFSSFQYNMHSTPDPALI